MVAATLLAWLPGLGGAATLPLMMRNSIVLDLKNFGGKKEDPSTEKRDEKVIVKKEGK